MAPPHLVDEVIGSILGHLVPGQQGFFLADNDDKNTLKTCTLVSQQFAFWSRSILYRSINLKKPSHVAHYLSLCRRYGYMRPQIKTLRIMNTDNIWNQNKSKTIRGYKNLVSLLDLLRLEGAVTRAHFLLASTWDELTPDVQDAILRFVLSRSFDVLEIGGICFCFPILAVPIPWISKRFHLNRFSMAGFKRNGKTIPSCTTWHDENMNPRPDALQSWGKSFREEQKEILIDAARSFYENDFINPEKTRLESLWIEADVIPMIEADSLYGPHANARIHLLRELLLTQVNDDSIPYAASLIQECQSTLESLFFMNLHVCSATSSGLSLLTNIDLPRLRTLTIMLSMAEDGELTKSMAWFLLHARKAKKLRLESLNLMFVDFTPNDGPLTFSGCTGNTSLIRALFGVFEFFKLEQVIMNLLEPKEGKVHLWFMFAASPGPVEEILIEEALEREFPKLLTTKRIMTSIGRCDEALKMADALSILPEGPALTRHEIEMREDEMALQFKDNYVKPRMDEFQKAMGRKFWG